MDPNIEVLATTTFNGEHDSWIDGVVMPVAWTKSYGAGKVFCLALGHDPNEFDHEGAQNLLMNGFRWAAK